MAGSRIAFFTDTFDEPNGVATISRRFLQFASQQAIPFLLVRPGLETSTISEGNSRIVQLTKSNVSVPLGMGLKFDLLAARHLPLLRTELEEFKADVLHVTGPGDLGMLGARLAHVLGIPLVMSWHTNLHQYANLRCQKYFRLFPRLWSQLLESRTETLGLRAAARFYQVADLVLAPNEEILTTLTRLTERPGWLMPHGVDCQRFQPRPREMQDGSLTIGYVGRLTPEKNVRIFAKLETELLSRGVSNVRFLLVGEGPERAWLCRRMERAVFGGVLQADALAHAYSQMDLFVFPSQSDTLGLVLLEAMASGLPILAYPTSGSRAVVRNEETGFLVETIADMVKQILALASDHHLRVSVGIAARLQALQFSWEKAFTSFYGAYAVARLQPDHDRSERLDRSIRQHADS